MQKLNVLSNDSGKLSANSTVSNVQQQTKAKIKRLAILAIFVSIELLLFFTPLGFVPVGPVNATTLHIPVIIAALLLGPTAGLSVGFVFGLLSLLKNTFNPTITSFVFSPFYSIGEIHGNLASLWIVLGPRLILGLGTALLFRLCVKLWHKPALSAGFSAVVMTFMHTILVMSSIYIFFAKPYAQVRQAAPMTLFTVIGTVIALNGVMELLLACFCAIGFVKVVKPDWVK